MPELQNSEILRTVLDSLQTGVCVLDREGRIAFWNQGAAQAAGYMQHEVIGRSYQEVMQSQHSEKSDPQIAACPWTRIMHEGKPTMLRMYLRHKRGYQVPVLVHMVPIRNQHGSIVAIAASFNTQNSRAQWEQSHHHPLPAAGLDVNTGIANHNFTLFHLRESLAGFAEYQIPFGIIRVRADGLGRFRAAYGHEAGDAVALVIAETLSNRLRPGDFLGRWGDDEFLEILSNCGRAGVRSVYEHTRKIIPAAEIRWWGELLSLPIVMGYSSVEVDDTIDSLLKRAQGTQRQNRDTTAVAGSRRAES